MAFRFYLWRDCISTSIVISEMLYRRIEVSSKIAQTLSASYLSFLVTFPVNIFPIIWRLFSSQIFIWVPLSPMIAICYESSEKHECLYLLGISTGRCFTGWWECKGEYSMLYFYYKTAKKCPSGLYSICMMGLEWWFISSIKHVFSISKILRDPSWKPAAKRRAFGCPLMQVQTSELGNMNS